MLKLDEFNLFYTVQILVLGVKSCGFKALLLSSEMRNGVYDVNSSLVFSNPKAFLTPAITEQLSSFIYLTGNISLCVVSFNYLKFSNKKGKTLENLVCFLRQKKWERRKRNIIPS